MKRVFVYEYVSAGGPVDGGPEAAAGLLPQGRSMRDAVAADLLAADAAEGLAVSVAVSAAAPFDDARATPLLAAPDETPLDFVARQTLRHDLVWIVAPETGGLLADFCRRTSPAQWIGCRPGAIRLAASKRATLLRLAGRGLPTPLAFERGAGATTGKDAGVTRWVVKPDDGAGAVATRVHACRAAAWDDWRSRSGGDGAAATIEPWVDGEPLSLSLLCGSVGGEPAVELLSINRQRIDVAADGSVDYRGVDVGAVALADPRAALLATLAGRTARAIGGLDGFVGIDLVWHAVRGPVVIEVNPRLTCAYVGLSRALGRNLGAEIVAAHALEAADAGA